MGEIGKLKNKNYFKSCSLSVYLHFIFHTAVVYFEILPHVLFSSSLFIRIYFLRLIYCAHNSLGWLHLGQLYTKNPINQPFSDKSPAFSVYWPIFYFCFPIMFFFSIAYPFPLPFLLSVALFSLHLSSSLLSSPLLLPSVHALCLNKMYPGTTCPN